MCVNICLSIILLIIVILYHDYTKKKKAEEKKKLQEKINTEIIDNLSIFISPENFEQEFFDACYGETAVHLYQDDENSPQQYRRNLKASLEKQEAEAKEDLAHAIEECEKYETRLEFRLQEIETFLNKFEGKFYEDFRLRCEKELKSEFSNISICINIGDDSYLNDTTHKEEIARIIRDKEQFEKEIFNIRWELSKAKSNQFEMYQYFRSCDNALEPNGKLEGFYRLEEFLTGNIDKEPFKGSFDEASELITRMAYTMLQFLQSLESSREAERKLSKITEQLNNHKEEFERWNL